MTLSTTSIDQLIEQVKNHIALHRTDVVAAPPRTRRGHFPPGVYERIDEAALLADSTGVQPFLTPPKVPIVGPLWQRVRLAAHNLVIFYVNRHAGAQMAFNRQVSGGLREIVECLDEDEGPASALEVAALRAEIKALQHRLARLEQATPGGMNEAE